MMFVTGKGDFDSIDAISRCYLNLDILQQTQKSTHLAIDPGEDESLSVCVLSKSEGQSANLPSDKNSSTQGGKEWEGNILTI